MSPLDWSCKPGQVVKTVQKTVLLLCMLSDQPLSFICMVLQLRPEAARCPLQDAPAAVF